MLIKALQNEVEEYIQRHKHIKDEEGHRKVVRNGSHKPRKVQTGAGELETNNSGWTTREKTGSFTSKLLPI